MILFDHRDENAEGEHFFANETSKILRDVEIEVGSLSLGDVLWKGHGDKTHIVELKWAHDVIVSLASGHLQDQIARLLDAREGDDASVSLVIVGVVDSDPAGLAVAYDTPESEPRVVGQAATYPRWFNYVSSIQEMGIEVQTTTSMAFGRALAAMYRRSLKSSHHHPARRQVRVVDRRVQALLALSTALTLPAAERLVKKYGSVREVLRRTPRALVEVEGVGPKSAGQLYDNGRECGELGVRLA